jgi:hypothetical protein
VFSPQTGVIHILKLSLLYYLHYISFFLISFQFSPLHYGTCGIKKKTTGKRKEKEKKERKPLGFGPLLNSLSTAHIGV